MQLIYEKSKPVGAPGASPFACPCPGAHRPPRLPEVPENEIVRHFTELADRNFGIDTGFYPLGSCTMKHNPRVNERAVGLRGSATSTRCRRTTERRARSSSCGSCSRSSPRSPASRP